MVSEDVKKVWAYIDEHKDEYIELLKKFCAQPSVSAQNWGMREMAELVRDTVTELGGNGTLIGASANVVLSDISKKFGHEITFMQFFKRGFPIMLFTVAIAAIYMVIRFPGG